MKNRYIVFMFLLLSGCSKIKTQQESNKVESHPKTEQILVELLNVFFEKYKREGSSKAIDFVFGSESGATLDQINELKNQLSKLSLAAGGFTGYEPVTEQRVGSSLVYYSYLVKHEIQPIRFIFIFYKAHDKWRIYKFKFDDQVDAELEEAGKLYFIK